MLRHDTGAHPGHEIGAAGKRQEVLDRIPVSDINQIVVEPLPTNTPATEKIVADKRGVSAWSFDLAAGEGKDIRFGWRVKWPVDREVYMHAAAK